MTFHKLVIFEPFDSALLRYVRYSLRDSFKTNQFMHAWVGWLVGWLVGWDI